MSIWHQLLSPESCPVVETHSDDQIQIWPPFNGIFFFLSVDKWVGWLGYYGKGYRDYIHCFHFIY